MTTLSSGIATSKSHLAYMWIRDGITSGRFAPGYRLVLGAIAGELGISVVPVREAIRLLEAEGFVTFEKNVGARVALIDEAEYVNAMEALALVEAFATALAVPRLGADDLAAARAVNDEMRLCLDDFDPLRFTELNHRFHALLFDGCPNPEVLGLVRRGWNRLSRLRSSTFTFVPGRSHESVAEHEFILRLVESGADVLEIELAVRRHRVATLDAFRAHRAGGSG
jgi:DNA-binding GntR family transcriptional regulator